MMAMKRMSMLSHHGSLAPKARELATNIDQYKQESDQVSSIHLSNNLSNFTHFTFLPHLLNINRKTSTKPTHSSMHTVTQTTKSIKKSKSLNRLMIFRRKVRLVAIHRLRRWQRRRCRIVVCRYSGSRAGVWVGVLGVSLLELNLYGFRGVSLG